MSGEATKPTVKPLRWIGSSKVDLLLFPREVIREVGHALWRAQLGEKHLSAKPLKGFGGATVLEIVDSDPSGTYRAVYTVRFADVVYVLHAFQKKSRKGISTDKQDIETIERRLKLAKEEHEKE